MVVRKTPSDYQQLALTKNIEWNGDFPPTTESHTEWSCKQGHTWQASYRSVKGAKFACPICTNVVRKTAEDYHALAKSRGFIWLGDSVTNARTKTRWRCAQGHEWEASYSTISQGHGCQLCFRPRKSAAEYRIYKRQWLRNDTISNPNKYRQKKQRYFTANPDALREQNHKRLSRKRNLPNMFTKTDWKRCLEWFENRCAVCEQVTKLTLDHWIPLSAPNCPGTIPSNVVSLCGSCNFSKQNKDARNWLQERFEAEKVESILIRIEAYFEWVKNKP